MKKIFPLSILLLSLVSCSNLSSSSSETAHSFSSGYEEPKSSTISRSSFHAVYLEKYSSNEDLFLLSDPSSESPRKLYFQPVLIKSFTPALELQAEYNFTYEKAISIPVYSLVPLTIEAPTSFAKVSQPDVLPAHDGSKAIKLRFASYQYYYDGMPTIPARSSYAFTSSFLSVITLDVDSLSEITLDSFKTPFLGYSSTEELKKDVVSSYHGIVEGKSKTSYDRSFDTLKDGDFVYFKTTKTVVAV